MPRPITKLSGLTTAELTLTKRGANNKRFAMTKGGLPMEPEVLQAIMSTPAEGEDAFVETLKSQNLDQDKLDAAVASFRVQKGMKDLVDNDVMSEVTKAAGYTAKAADDDKDRGVEPFTPKKQPGADPKASDDSGNLPGKKKKKMGKSLDLSGLDDESRGQVEAIFKSHQAQASKTEALEAVVKSMQDDKLEREYIAKAADEYGNLPLDSAELGVMLKSAHDISPDFAKGFETLMGRLDGFVQKSALVTTMGAVNKTQSGGAMDKMNTIANEIVQKSIAGGNKISKTKAMSEILKSENADELYRQYLGDNPAQRGNTY